jgi:hypothetical protein
VNTRGEGVGKEEKESQEGYEEKSQKSSQEKNSETSTCP